jgi:hypothetical protein
MHVGRVVRFPAVPFIPAAGSGWRRLAFPTGCFSGRMCGRPGVVLGATSGTNSRSTRYRNEAKKARKAALCQTSPRGSAKGTSAESRMIASMTTARITRMELRVRATGVLLPARRFVLELFRIGIGSLQGYAYTLRHADSGLRVYLVCLRVLAYAERSTTRRQT